MFFCHVDNRFALDDNASVCLGHIKEDIEFHGLDCVTAIDLCKREERQMAVSGINLAIETCKLQFDELFLFRI